jgi:hypothetical protein
MEIAVFCSVTPCSLIDYTAPHHRKQESSWIIWPSCSVNTMLELISLFASLEIKENLTDTKTFYNPPKILRARWDGIINQYSRFSRDSAHKQIPLWVLSFGEGGGESVTRHSILHREVGQIVQGTLSEGHLSWEDPSWHGIRLEHVYDNGGRFSPTLASHW